MLVFQDDVYQHDPELGDWIAGNTTRFCNLFYEVVDELIIQFLGDRQVRFWFWIFTFSNPKFAKLIYFKIILI